MMNDERTFRLVLVAGSLLVFPVVAYHRVRSQATRERLDRRQEGLFILLTLRPTGVLCMLALVAYMLNPSWMSWSSVTLPTWLRWAGAGLGAVTAALLFWTLRTLGANLTDTVVTRKTHTLVTSGPYRWVRHPFYDSMALAVFANSLVTANWFIFLTGGLTILLIVVRLPKEEERLLARFGEPYRAYLERTGRFLPRFVSR